MATYQSHTWNDYSTPAINADNLNQMEDGIAMGVAAFNSLISTGSLVEALNTCLASPSTYRLAVTEDETTHEITFSAEAL